LAFPSYSGGGDSIGMQADGPGGAMALGAEKIYKTTTGKRQLTNVINYTDQ